MRIKRLNLSDDMEKQLGRNRNTVLSVWYKIAYFEKRYGYCDKTDGDFSRMLDISIPTVQRALRKLIKLGLVKKEKRDFWHRKLYVIRPDQEIMETVNKEEEVIEQVKNVDTSNDPLYSIVYGNKYNKDKYNEYHKPKNEEVIPENKVTEVEIKPIEVEILRDEFDAEIVDKALHILNQKEERIFNVLKYTRGICLNIIKNQKSLAKKEIKKQKQLALFEEIKASRSERNDFIVPNNWYYDWMEV